MIYFISALLGGAGAWCITRYAHVLGLIDYPCERSSHNRPTPKGGGFGLLLAFILACFWFGLSISCWLPAAALSLLGLFGDRIELNPGFRLVIQFFAAGLFLAGTKLPFRLETEVYILLPFFAIYIVGTANFYNFMDGINGIAGITGLVCFLLLGVYGLTSGQDTKWVMLAFVLASACAGFLPFNIPRARVFMGDVGSILLGFLFACFVVKYSTNYSDFIVLTCFLFLFFADELTTMLERISDRQSLTIPHRRHLYQVLANEAGLPHWKISLCYGLAQLIIGLTVWNALELNAILGVVVVIFFVSVFVLVNNQIKKSYLA